MNQENKGNAQIHPTAIVDAEVQLAQDVVVGPYAVISGPVTIGAGTIIKSHCVIAGSTRIGKNCKIGPAAYLGQDPQHLKFVADRNAPTWLIVGDNVTIRESGRIHRAFHAGEENATRIGDDCFLMGAIHIAHDCVIEPDVILADGVLLGGHCHIGRRSFVGGGCTIHQFVRVGRLSIVGGNEALAQDVPPFSATRYGRLKGYNAVGCKRAGMDRAVIVAVRAFYQRMRNIRTMTAVLAAVKAQVPDLPEVREMIEFIRSTKRGILPAHRGITGRSRVGEGFGESDADAEE